MFRKFSILVLLLLLLFVPALAFGQSPSLKCVNGTTLSWEPNTEADLAGYKLYNADSALVLQDLAGKTPLGQVGASAPKVDGRMQFKPVLSTLIPEKQNYFTITAFDTANNESMPSNVVSCNNNQAPKAPTGLLIE